MANELTNAADFFESARREWPTHFAVTAVPNLYPGGIAPGTIYNQISLGVGPRHEKVGGRLILERNSFIDWLQTRPRAVKRVRQGKEGHGDA